MQTSLFSAKTLNELLLVLLTIAVAMVVNSLLRSLVKVPRRLETRRRKTYETIVRNIITLAIFYIALHVIFIVVGINITPLLASAGIIGIVMGIGAQSVVKDLIAGFFLFSQSNIAIGDYINIGAGIEGTVLSIGLKNSTLLGSNGALIVVPNGNISNVINYSYGKANTIVDIMVKPQLPIDETLTIFEDIVKELKQDKTHTVLEGSKVIGVKDIGVGSITISTLLVMSYLMRGSIEPEFRYRILKAFEKRKISLM